MVKYIHKINQDKLIKKLILMLCLAFIALPVLAQKNLEGTQKNYTVDVNTSDGYARVTVINKKPNFKPKSKVFYYWYAYGKIMSTMEGYDGHLLNGIYTCFYDNNNLKEKGFFKKGLKVGRWKAWFENGALKEESNWCAGLRNGLTVTYNEDGSVESIENYKNGIYNGKVIQYESGQVTSTQFYKNGVEYTPKHSHKIKDSLSHQNVSTDSGSASEEKPKNKKNIFQKIKKLFAKKKDDDGITNQNVTN
jgi:hypothetical protein